MAFIIKIDNSTEEKILIMATAIQKTNTTQEAFMLLIEKLWGVWEKHKKAGEK